MSPLKKATAAYDTTQKQWRHMNFFQYACYFVARPLRVVRVPLIYCAEDGVLQVMARPLRPGRFEEPQ